MSGRTVSSYRRGKIPSPFVLAPLPSAEPLWAGDGIPSGRAGPDGGRRRLSVNRTLILFSRNRPPVPLRRGEAAEASQKNQIASREIQYFASPSRPRVRRPPMVYSWTGVVPCRRGQLSVAAPPGTFAQQGAPSGRRRNVPCRVVSSYRTVLYRSVPSTDTRRYEMIRYDIIRYDTIQYGMV